MKTYTLAETGQHLTEEQAQRIMQKNREILALPADEFIRRIHEARFLIVTEVAD